MNRKQFLLTGFAFSPILALAEPFTGKKGKRSASKPFIVDEAKSRFGDVILFKGVNLTISKSPRKIPVASFPFSNTAE
jgi:hypothetical protein